MQGQPYILRVNEVTSLAAPAVRLRAKMKLVSEGTFWTSKIGTGANDGGSFTCRVQSLGA